MGQGINHNNKSVIIIYTFIYFISLLYILFTNTIPLDISVYQVGCKCIPGVSLGCDIRVAWCLFGSRGDGPLGDQMSGLRCAFPSLIYEVSMSHTAWAQTCSANAPEVFVLLGDEGVLISIC